MKFDDILVEIGEFGWYQAFLVGLLFILVGFGAFQDMGYIFTSAIPNYRCYVNGCDNGTTTYAEDFLNFTTPYDDSNDLFSQCQLFSINDGSYNDSCPIDKFNWTSKYDCDLWKYDNTDYISTTVTQFNLVCDKENLAALGQSIYWAGGMFGGILAGMAADKYGRRTTLLVSTAVYVVCGLSSAFVPNYPLYLVLNFIMGGGINGIDMTIFVMSVEFVGKSARGITGMLFSLPYTIGEIVFGGLAYAIRDYRYLQTTISAPFALVLVYYWIIPESPRWLLVNGKVKEAEKTLTKIAKANGKTLTVEMLNDFDPEDEGTKLAEVEKLTWLDLFRTSNVLLITVVMCLVWLFVSMSYFGITMSAPSALGGNQYVNFIIMAAFEIPAVFLGPVSVNKFGRRYTLCFTLIFGGIAGICTAIVPESSEYRWLSITLATIGKFGASIAYDAAYVITAELYPTGLRNNGMAICGFAGCLGSVIAPYIALLSRITVYLPLAIFGICTLIAGLMSLTLPETLGKRLPETVKDCEELAVCSCFSRYWKSQ